MEKGLKEQIKTVIHSLLVPHAKGLTIDKLLREYAECEGKQLPLRTLGYDSPLQFFRSIPDVLDITRMATGHVVIQAVPKEGVSHIQELVKGQNNSKSKSVKMFKNLLQNKPVALMSASPAAARFNIGRPVFGAGKRQYSQAYHQPTFNTSNYHSFQPMFCNGQHSDVPPPTVKETVLPHILAKQNAELESSLIRNLISLLKEFPNGVDIGCIDVFYTRAYQKPIDLDCISTGLTLTKFFEKHRDKFFLRLKDKRIYVNVINASQQMQGTEARVKLAQPLEVTAKQIEQTPSGLHQELGISNQANIDLRSTGAILKVAYKHESPSNEENNDSISNTKPRTKNDSYRNVISISKLVGNPRKPLCVGGITETFGVRRPDVDDVCTPDTYIEHEPFPDVPDMDFFFIIVAEVSTPGKFYWFLNKNRKAIEQLTDDLVLFYNLHDEYVCSLKEMYVGQIVAARYVDNLWYRAQITGFHDGNFQMFYIDYGSNGPVTIEKIRHLPLHFATLPVQAFRGRLYGIEPPKKDGKWTAEASNCFLKLIKGSRVIAAAKIEQECLLITDDEYEISYALTLVDTNSDKDLHIGDYLIDQGLAVSQHDEAVNGDLNPYSQTNHDTVDSPVPTDAAQERSTPIVEGIQLAYELEKRLTLSHGLESFSVEGNKRAMSEVRVAENGTSSDRLSSMRPANMDTVAFSKRQVKRIDFDDGRSFFIIKTDDELFLPKFELLQLIPNLNSQMKAANVNVNEITKKQSDYPELFIECLTEQAPWIKDANGDVISILSLYLLRHVPTLLFLFGKDREASSAFEAQLKDTRDPYWEEPRQSNK